MQKEQEEPKMEDKIKDLKIAFIGELDWRKLRDLMVLKMSDCHNEEEFTFLLKAMIGSMFTSTEELDEVRKKLQLELITNKKRKRIKEIEG